MATALIDIMNSGHTASPGYVTPEAEYEHPKRCTFSNNEWSAAAWTGLSKEQYNVRRLALTQALQSGTRECKRRQYNYRESLYHREELSGIAVTPENMVAKLAASEQKISAPQAPTAWCLQHRYDKDIADAQGNDEEKYIMNRDV